MVPSHCPLPHIGARTLLTYEGAGQRFDWARLPSAAATLNASLHRLRPVDVVVFNAGDFVHLNYCYFCGTVAVSISDSFHIARKAFTGMLGAKGELTRAKSTQI